MSNGGRDPGFYQNLANTARAMEQDVANHVVDPTLALGHHLLNASLGQEGELDPSAELSLLTGEAPIAEDDYRRALEAARQKAEEDAEWAKRVCRLDPNAVRSVMSILLDADYKLSPSTEVGEFEAEFGPSPDYGRQQPKNPTDPPTEPRQ